jgi:twitching motility protein PilT
MAALKSLEDLLDLVVDQGASDLHIFAGGAPMLRVSGALIPVAKYPALTNEQTEEMLKSIVPPDRWD